MKGKIYTSSDMYHFAKWYERKIHFNAFAKYAHPVNGKKDIETIEDLIQVWKNETKKDNNGGK